MNREHEDLSESRPEISAVEAALAQLRPRRESRFADEVKNQMRDALAEKTQPSEKLTETVRIPLTRYIRIAQFNAAAGGLLAGLLLGGLLGGLGVFFALSRFDAESSRPAPSLHAARYSYLRTLLEDDASLTPLERALFEKLDEEPSHGGR